MHYPSEFPRDARARVEAETRRAHITLVQDARGMESRGRDVPFLRCVMRIFLAFAREACEFGIKSHHPAWSDCELDQRCRDFLLEIAIDAWEHKGKDLGINKMFSSQGWGFSINEDDRQRIEKSAEWKQYQDVLIEAFDAQSAPDADDSLPQPEPGAQAAPVRRNPKDFIDASRGRRSYEKFAAHVGISKDTLYAITRETRWVSDANYRLVATACECNPEDLHPRGVPPLRRP